MKTICSIPRFPVGQEITQILASLMRKNDDTFGTLEHQYLKNTKLLTKCCDSKGPSFAAFIEAEEQTIQINFLYAAYLGFRANLENFRCPAGYPFLNLDYTEFLKEHLMGHDQVSQKAERIKEQFRCLLPTEYEQSYDGISEYYTALDVVGPKLAHYWGYQFANKLLPLVEPGYCPDDVQTIKYGMMLKDYLGFYPPELGAPIVHDAREEHIA